MANPKPDPPPQPPDDGTDAGVQPGLESLTAAAEATQALAKQDDPEA